jgi:Zn-dependent protease with chaperone function/predicted  nucleic acid-binding Zn-ribbon protein
MAELLADFVPTLGLALLHFLWQGALIGLLAVIALDALRNARPQARYAVACLALLACALAPGATVLWMLAPELIAPDFGGALGALGGDTEDVGDGALAALAPSLDVQAWLPAIVATWAAGTCALSLRMAVGLAWVRRLRQQPQGPAQLAWQQRLDAIAANFQLRRRVSLRVVDELESPVSAGWWRPVVLLPASLLTRMPAALIEALLAHELAHIRRHDYLVNLLQNVVEALLFYHPVVWWLSHRIRVEREQIADQLATELACAPRDLALALSELSELQGTVPGPALRILQAAEGYHLMSRIQRLLRPTSRTHAGARVVFPLLGLAAAVVATYGWAESRSEESGVTAHGTFYVDGKRHGDSFALVRGRDDAMHMWGSVDDIEAIKSARRGMSGDYLWFRRGGRAYLVTDPALLARAAEATRETDALDQKMEELEAQMAPHEQKLEALEERMDALTDDSEPSPRAEAAENTMESLARQQETLGRRMEDLAERMQDAEGDEASIERLAQQMDELGKQQDALASRMDEQARVIDEETKGLEARQAPMEALAREMEQASKPMEAISKQMEAQSQLIEKASARVEGELQKLIDEAVARKLATPVGAG